MTANNPIPFKKEKTSKEKIEALRELVAMSKECLRTLGITEAVELLEQGLEQNQ